MKLKNLELDEHAKDKFLRLVGDRYDPKTDYVTITTDSCPLKKQNYDYAQYLITALLFESWVCTIYCFFISPLLCDNLLQIHRFLL